MKCPDCKGKKVKQEFDSRGLRQYTCRTCGGKGSMDKIQEEFEKQYEEMCKLDDEWYPHEKTSIHHHNVKIWFEKGFKAADLLPTEKVCPECGGDCEIMDDDLGLWVDCQKCDTKGIIQIYYTPEQYKEIMGKPYPDDALGWYLGNFGWISVFYGSLKPVSGMDRIYIVQTAQSAPPADYRPEE